MIESLINVQMIDYLEEYNFISVDQSAQLKRHSMITSSDRVIDNWLESMNDEMLMGSAFYDILNVLTRSITACFLGKFPSMVFVELNLYDLKAI